MAETRETEGKLHAMSDTVQDAIIMINAQGHVVFWNPAAEKSRKMKTICSRFVYNLYMLILYRSCSEKTPKTNHNSSSVLSLNPCPKVNMLNQKENQRLSLT